MKLPPIKEVEVNKLPSALQVYRSLTSNKRIKFELRLDDRTLVIRQDPKRPMCYEFRVRNANYDIDDYNGDIISLNTEILCSSGIFNFIRFKRNYKDIMFFIMNKWSIIVEEWCRKHFKDMKAKPTISNFKLLEAEDIDKRLMADSKMCGNLFYCAIGDCVLQIRINNNPVSVQHTYLGERYICIFYTIYYNADGKIFERKLYHSFPLTRDFYRCHNERMDEIKLHLSIILKSANKKYKFRKYMKKI